MLKSATVCFFVLVSFTACYYDKGDVLYPADPNAVCDTVNMSYNNHIKPILENRCVSQGCHTSINPSGGVILENHNKVSDAIAGDKLIKAIRYEAGGSKNMPPTGKISDCEIKKIEAWIARGYPNN